MDFAPSQKLGNAVVNDPLLQTATTRVRKLTHNDNYNDFFCANILKDQAQWRDKTKGLSKLVIENNAWVVNGWMKKLGG